GTLLSGNYIGFERGTADRVARRFTGLESPRVVERDAPGRAFTVRAPGGEKAGGGLPIYHLGLQVGQGTSVPIAAHHHALELGVFINAPYDAEVRANTRFWNVGGLDVSVDASGVNVRTESLVTMLIGGLAFEAPHNAPGDSAAAGTTFTLYRDRAIAMK